MDKPNVSVPSGIEHPPNLDQLPKAERLRHFRRCIQAILPKHGSEGVSRFVERYPEAAEVRWQNQPKAYLPKPAGYAAAISSMVEAWFDSKEALDQSNTADVARLNEKLGTTFPPANHFNTPLSTALAKKLRAVFEARGAHFDEKRMDTLSKVRKAVATAKQGADPETIEFGSIGRRSQNKLHVGSRDFAITKHGQRECIRPKVNGRQPRLYLDDILWLSELLNAEVSPGVSTPSLRSKYVERDHLADKAHLAPDSLTRARPSEASSEDSLTRARPNQIEPDPLADITAADIAALRDSANPDT